MFVLGYNTNGFAHHRLEDALAILAEIGYRSVAVTVERDLLDPPDPRAVTDAARRLNAALRTTELRCTIETGSRFILDPRRKHQPTLLSADPPERRRRVDFLDAAIDLAAEVGAESVSLWSGSPDDNTDRPAAHDRLIESLAGLLDRARRAGVRLAFEPEPGMVIDTMESFAEVHDALNHPSLGLTLDVGHVHCLSDGDVGEHVDRWRGKLWNVHLEDMRRGIHEHLMFGDGEMDFVPVFRALRSIDYHGPVHVELSRHGHDAVRTARCAYEFLRPFL
ncbi:MAG: sugar phosphate isomerase/epimerase family protein [Planctomycetota bacterium]